jgi:hypothetical protein
VNQFFGSVILSESREARRAKDLRLLLTNRRIATLFGSTTPTRFCEIIALWRLHEMRSLAGDPGPGDGSNPD